MSYPDIVTINASVTMAHVLVGVVWVALVWVVWP